MSLIGQSAAAKPLPSCPPALSGPFPPTYNLHDAASSPCPGAGRLARSQKAQALSRLLHAEQPWRPLFVPTASQVETPTSRPETPGALVGRPRRGSLSICPSSRVSLSSSRGGGMEASALRCPREPRSPENPHPLPGGVWGERYSCSHGFKAPGRSAERRLGAEGGPLVLRFMSSPTPESLRPSR